jgi:hypothetical protein
MHLFVFMYAGFQWVERVCYSNAGLTRTVSVGWHIWG